MTKSPTGAFKKYTSTELRTCSPYHHIDPGFINRRKIFSVFREPFVEAFEKHRDKGSDHWATLKNDHFMTQMCIDLCKSFGIKSLSQALIDGPGLGQLICSTEEIQGNEKVWDDKRIKCNIILPFDFTQKVILELSTEHIFSSTTKGELAQGTNNSILGEIRSITNDEIIIHPLIIGAPTYDHPKNKPHREKLMFSGWDQYEVFPEDILEFAEIAKVELSSSDEWLETMKKLPESEVKNKVADILGDLTKKDWGGEQNDHFSTSITLGSKRTSAAFLLKGPAKFQEMQPRHLGKNADQIYRLAACPANLLIVQHCHDIGEAVRATLRAFAVTPHNPRYYCLIDGKDTYKLLKAYNKI